MTDLQLARDKQQGFEDWKRENAADKPLAMELQVTVLTTGFWPSYKVRTPQNMHFCLPKKLLLRMSFSWDDQVC